MADVLAVRDEYRAQTWAMLIQECNNSGLWKPGQKYAVVKMPNLLHAR